MMSPAKPATKTYGIISDIITEAARRLPSVHRRYAVIEWEVRTTYNGRRNPAWEVDVRVRGPQGELTFHPICTYLARPGDFEDEVDLMIWCLRVSYNMRARLAKGIQV